MANFSAHFPESEPITFSSPFPLLDPHVESIAHQFNEINHQSLLLENSSNFTNNFNSFLPDHFFNHQTLPENFPSTVYNQNLIISDVSNSASASAPEIIIENKKRKALDISGSSNSMSSCPQGKSKNISRRGKKAKGEKEEEDKPKEVVHVRARRGQATDSHSLAERVRRGKINERLKCLQDIVPGCYKTMGMAVMLDEIINYVQSLQNQVEFLSMKLTAASTFYDFNSETDAIETLQRAKAQEMERGSMSTHYHPSWSL